MVYPWSPGPVTSDRSCSRDARYSAGPFAGFMGGVVAPQGVGQVRPGRPLAGGGGRGGALCGLGSAGPLAAGPSSGGVRSI